MPGFSFAKGNAAKLLALPLYALGAIASMLVPRSNSQWVFGCGSGVGEGSLALIRYVRATDPQIHTTWLARDPAEQDAAEALGLASVVKTSARGLLLTLRARVIVITHGFGDANRYGSRGAFVAQLWHGVPLKLIQLDSSATTRVRIPIVGQQGSTLLRRFYRRGYRTISLMPAASELAASRLRTAFQLAADRVVVTGDPRDDILSAATPTARRETSREVLFAALETPVTTGRVLLFAPTWRDGEADPVLPTDHEWRAIGDWLESADAMLVVRPHPLGIGDYAAGAGVSARVHLLGSNRLTDVTTILSAVDLLITDYSSIAFDYSLTGGPVLFIAPDEDAYASSRGLYEPYRQFSGGRQTRSWTALIAQLRRFDSDPEWAESVRAHSQALRERHFAFDDGHNTERVYEQILRELESRR